MKVAFDFPQEATSYFLASVRAGWRFADKPDNLPGKTDPGSSKSTELSPNSNVPGRGREVSSRLDGSQILQGIPWAFASDPFS